VHATLATSPFIFLDQPLQQLLFEGCIYLLRASNRAASIWECHLPYFSG